MKFLWHLYDMMYMYTCVCVQFYKKIRCAYVRVSVYLNIFLKNLKVGNDPNNIVSIHTCLQLYMYITTVITIGLRIFFIKFHQNHHFQPKF